jgi:hypothetical protein
LTKGDKILLAQYDIDKKKLITSETGIGLSRPMFVFAESDKNKGIVIIDSKEFKEVTFKLGDGGVSKNVSQISLQGIITSETGPFIPYYNVKSSHLYLVFPKTQSYLVLRHKKKKLVHLSAGTLNSPLPEVQGIVGISKPDSEERFFLYNKQGVYEFTAKKNVPSNLVQSPVYQEPPKQPKEVKKEEKKKKKKKATPEQPLTQEAAIEETTINLKALIKKEIDEGIKTLVLPIIDSHMKRFEIQFRELVGQEVASLKSILQSETIKMQNTGQVFETFMERMMEVSRKFTGSLETQMKELAHAVGNKEAPVHAPTHTQVQAPAHAPAHTPVHSHVMSQEQSPFLIPTEPRVYSASRVEQQRPINDFGRSGVQGEYRPRGEYAGHDYREPMRYG